LKGTRRGTLPSRRLQRQSKPSALFDLIFHGAYRQFFCSSSNFSRACLQESFDHVSEFDRAAWPEIAGGIEALPACCCCLPSQANIGIPSTEWRRP